MPIYQYACLACGHEVEALQKINEDPLTDCPECGEAALRKKVTAAAFRLKGSGWYETDFKHKGKPGKDGGDKSAKKDDGGSGSQGTSAAKAENKSAAKKPEGG